MTQTSPLSRAAVLDGFAAVAQAAGLDPLALLAEQRLPAGCLTDPEQRIPASSVIALFERAAQAADMPDFGLAMADVRGFATLGAVGLVMREQRDLRSALGWLIDYGWVQTESVVPRLEAGAEVTILDLTLAPGLPNSAPQSIELSLASIARLIRALLGPGWQPEMVLCSHARPRSVLPYLRHFGQAPVFGADRDALVLRSSDLDHPIAGADPGAARELERYLGLVAGPRCRKMADRVEALIEQSLPRGTCRIDNIARTLSADRRTVHRRLRREGTTFTELVDRVRTRLVERQLASQTNSLTEIAEQAGFSSLSALSRWRRQRRGRSGLMGVPLER
ncbi:AraC family transcriptional regulator [Novosphingobium sp. B 225]|uniref:AraC family transcriptional regulator n=1 Tax=Novosphingobium sp. B 225 TaxID=1961849 RepID=UPI000B4C0DCC|nr:AraC family transcriptional regulator [Novosphingobium sp. B 225]